MAESYISKITVNGESFLVKDNEARDSILNLATVSTTGSYDDLSNKPTLGTAAAQNVEYFDAAGSASSALNSAKSYADGLATNYDAAGSANTALSSAKSYTDTEVAKKATKATTLSGYGITDAINVSEKASANGVATLGSDGLVPSTQLPSYVDDVLEYDDKDSFPSEGESGKIYVDLDKNLTYRWGGTAYIEISPSISLGETSSTAYAGDKGKANADAIAELQAKTYTAEDVGAIPAEDIHSIKYITQEAYDTLEEKDSTVLYLIH